MSTGHTICPQCSFENPNNKQFCQSCLYNIHYRSVKTSVKQPWVAVEERLMPDPRAMDAQGERKATEAMLAQRKTDLAASAQSRSWEKGRKKEWQKNKPIMMKQIEK